MSREEYPNPKNPNFSYIYGGNLLTAIRVVAVIKNDRTQWEEDFLVTSFENARTEVEEVIEYFNSTMKPTDRKRFVVEVKGID
jgi:hypothetical protein